MNKVCFDWKDMPSEYQNCKVYTGIELKFMPSNGGSSNKPNNVKYGVSVSGGGFTTTQSTQIK